jgi:N-acetylglucosamine-6-phosphate deacetylase
VALRAKTVERSVLVTDAVTPAGSAPGRYRVGELEVDLLPEGRVVLAGGDRLAGSALRMDRGVENLMALAGIPLGEAVRMATTNAARAGGVPGRSAGLAPGDRADLVRFRCESDRIEILETWLAGRKVFAS